MARVDPSSHQTTSTNAHCFTNACPGGIRSPSAVGLVLKLLRFLPRTGTQSSAKEMLLEPSWWRLGFGLSLLSKQKSICFLA